MAANFEFQRINEWRWLRGFNNLFRKENQAWWRTRRWWINALLWSGLLGALTANMLFVPTIINLASSEEIAQAGGETPFLLLQSLNVLFQFGTQIVSLGAIVLCLDLLIEEKRNGVAEWLLSKPVKRQAYVLAKLISNLAHLLLFLVLLPSGVVYVLLSLRAGPLFPPIPFLTGVGIMALHVLFYISLTILLGAFFNSRAPILGITLGSLFGGNILGGFVRPLLYVTPWLLPNAASSIASSQPIPDELIWFPVCFTLLWSVVFIIIALYRFEREEF